MKKILLLLIVVTVFYACENEQNEDVINEQANSEVLQKTDRMLRFEKSIAEFGRLNGNPDLKDIVLQGLVTDSKNYLSDHGQVMPDDDIEIINAALDFHLQKINELRKNH